MATLTKNQLAQDAQQIKSELFEQHEDFDEQHETQLAQDPIQLAQNCQTVILEHVEHLEKLDIKENE